MKISKPNWEFLFVLFYCSSNEWTCDVVKKQWSGVQLLWSITLQQRYQDILLTSTQLCNSIKLTASTGVSPSSPWLGWPISNDLVYLYCQVSAMSIDKLISEGF